MTDKQRIINGVDVSECEFLWKEKLPKRFCNNGNLDCDCNSNPNCYYKQLKRKEQECEGLKEELRECRIGIKDISIESTGICKISEKYKRTLDEVEKYLDAQQKYFDGEDYHNLLDIIKKVKGENVK